MRVMNVQLKRAYEPAAVSDGYRVLIDRLWPRGVSREEARLDEWARELAPSAPTRDPRTTARPEGWGYPSLLPWSGQLGWHPP
jgi:uncharacterized protein YeaO (DUF488 family)